MNITVRGKNIEVTPALRDYVEKKASRITKYFSDVREVKAVLSVKKNEHIVELTVSVNGIILRAQEKTGDMYTSIDLVVDKIERQVTKHKTKLTKKFRSAPNQANVEFLSDLVPDSQNGDDEFKIIKTKRFSIKPMTAEEAIMQMNLLNHDFFVYFDGDENAIRVVYKRADGDYGLIAPELK